MCSNCGSEYDVSKYVDEKTREEAGLAFDEYLKDQGMWGENSKTG